MTFLEKYLPEWLPPQHQGIILDLLSHIPLQTFSGTPLFLDTTYLLIKPSPPNHPPQPPRNRSPQRPNHHQPPPHPADLLHHAPHEVDRPSSLLAIRTNTQPSGHPPRASQAHEFANANPPHNITHRIHHLPNTNAPVVPPASGRTTPVDPPATTTAINNISDHLHSTITLNPIAALLAAHQLESGFREQRQYSPGSRANRIAKCSIDGHVQPALPLSGFQRRGWTCVGLPHPTACGD